MNLARVANILLLSGLAALLLSAVLVIKLRADFPADWPRATRITCNNNLHQIAKSLRMWGMDNQDTYPYNLSTNAGGTLEFCDRDKEGFDRNAFIHYRVMSNELSTTRALVCPQDYSKHPAPGFAHLKRENVSYLLRTGTNVSEANPNAIVVVCPIHRSFIRCDGSVTEAKPEPEPWWLPYKDLLDYDERTQLSFHRILRTFTASALLLIFGGGLKLFLKFRPVTRPAA